MNNSKLSDITEENEYENVSNISHPDQISQNLNTAEPELVYVHLTHTAETSPGNSREYQRTNKETSVAVLYNHNISEDLEDETLPPSEQFFDENMELKFESLQKTLSLDDADYSQCPSDHLANLKSMLKQYEDRFSKSKLDLPPKLSAEIVDSFQDNRG